jgi:hypothetical protein
VTCCEAWSPLYGCPHEICGGCYLDKKHDEKHCRGGCTCTYEECTICQGDSGE